LNDFDYSIADFRLGKNPLNKRIFAFVLVPLMLTAAHFAMAEQYLQARRIGVTDLSCHTDQNWDAFLRGLRELGYEEGKNITIECARVERLVRERVDVIVTRSGVSTRAAWQATNTIPIVMTVDGEPVKSGVTASLAHPSGNVTGLTSVTSELSGKRLELLKEIIPTITHVAILSSFPYPEKSFDFLTTQTVARALGVQLQPLGVYVSSDFENAFQAATRQHAEARITISHPFISSHMIKIVALAARGQLPVMYHRREFVEAGGLVSYGPRYSDLYRRAAYFVDRILRGAKPSDLPVEQPTKFELVINLKTAKQLSLTTPPKVLMWADRVIE
jgi:ABC-type uncharacterized transport system substrate-binding protein